MRVKKCILVILSILLLCSCAGTGHKGIVNVPGQDVSFISPQADWETTLFTSTSKVPSGGFLPIKFFRGSWSRIICQQLELQELIFLELKKQEQHEQA